MNVEKYIYKGLKIFFSICTGIMFLLLIVGLIVVGIELISGRILLDFERQNYNTTMIVIGFISSFAVLFLSVLSCYTARSFFKNLELNRIFIKDNVVIAKRYSFIILIKIVIDLFSNLYFFYTNIPNSDEFYTSSTSIFYSFLEAIIIWSMAKILEKAILIADENELTI